MGAGPGGAGVRLRGRHLLDHEALTCLLVLLFIDEPKMNTSRLHRVLRNLCYHAATRAWVVQALLSILQRMAQGRAVPAAGAAVAAGGEGCEEGACSDCGPGHLSWLSISLDAALGCRSNVFQLQHGADSGAAGGKRHANAAAAAACPSIAIHQQAAPLVCRHVLDTLISLARSFPAQFLPESCGAPAATAAAATDDKSSAAAARPPPAGRCDTDFWELLVRLDGVGGARKGKGAARAAPPPAPDTSLQASFEASALAQLMDMLAHPVVRRSQQLTDRLLRLLALVSVGLPDLSQPAADATVTPPSGAAGTGGTAGTAATTAATAATGTCIVGMRGSRVRHRAGTRAGTRGILAAVRNSGRHSLTSLANLYSARMYTDLLLYAYVHVLSCQHKRKSQSHEAVKIYNICINIYFRCTDV